MCSKLIDLRKCIKFKICHWTTSQYKIHFSQDKLKKRNSTTLINNFFLLSAYAAISNMIISDDQYYAHTILKIILTLNYSLFLGKIPSRLNIGLMLFASCFVSYMLRVNMSINILSMVHHYEHNVTANAEPDVSNHY